MTGPGGIPVKGSRYAPNKRRFRRRFFPQGPRPADQNKPAEGQVADGHPVADGDGSEEAGPLKPQQQRRRRPRRPPLSERNVSRKNARVARQGKKLSVFDLNNCIMVDEEKRV